MTSRTLILLASCAIFGLSGCSNTAPQLPHESSVSADNFVYNKHNFGPNRTESYRKGVIDGCKTSSGEYTKDHTRFQTSLDYHSGWEHGRLHCKGTQS